MKWDGLAGRVCGVAALMGAWEVASGQGHGIAVASPGETFAALAGLLSQPTFWLGDLAVGVFEESALAAANSYRFVPGKVGGQHVATLILVPFHFKMAN